MNCNVKMSLITLLATVFLAGCGGSNGDGNEIIGSCREPELSDESRMCFDASRDAEEIIRAICKVGRGKWSDEDTCDRNGAIAGCRQGNGVISWTYPSEKASTIDEVRDACKGVFIPVESGD